MTITEKKNMGFSFGLILFSLVILCQPNVNIIDIFPDFIAFFIIAKMFEEASVVLPYLDEAKSGFYRLGFLDIFRFLCQFLVLSSVNTDSRNDTMALFSFSFSVIECLLLVKAIQKTFDALFYLGERSDCSSLIRPFRAFGTEIKPEFLQRLLAGFFGLKALTAFLPDLLRLFQSGKTSLLYRNAVWIGICVVSLAAVFVLITTSAYVKSIKTEHRFHESLSALYKDNVSSSVQHGKIQILSSAFLFMFVSTVFTAFLPIDTFHQADLFPGFLFPLLFLFGLFRLKEVANVDKSLFTFCIVLTAIGFLSFVIRPVYFSEYDITDVQTMSGAGYLYGLYEGICIAECVVCTAFLLKIRKTFDTVIETQTGVPVGSDDYRQTDRDYHKGLKKLNHVAVVFGMATLFLRTIKILTDSQSYLTIIKNEGSVVGSVTMSAFPWLGMAVNVTATLFCFFFYYFSSTLKEEWNV